MSDVSSEIFVDLKMYVVKRKSQDFQNKQDQLTQFKGKTEPKSHNTRLIHRVTQTDSQSDTDWFTQSQVTGVWRIVTLLIIVPYKYSYLLTYILIHRLIHRMKFYIHTSVTFNVSKLERNATNIPRWLAVCLALQPSYRSLAKWCQVHPTSPLHTLLTFTRWRHHCTDWLNGQHLDFTTKFNSMTLEPLPMCSESFTFPVILLTNTILLLKSWPLWAVEANDHPSPLFFVCRQPHQQSAISWWSASISVSIHHAQHDCFYQSVVWHTLYEQITVASSATYVITNKETHGMKNNTLPTLIGKR